jgi:hypothetical protein
MWASYVRDLAMSYTSIKKSPLASLVGNGIHAFLSSSPVPPFLKLNGESTMALEDRHCDWIYIIQSFVSSRIFVDLLIPF